MIDFLKENEVFVFGSNTQGRHGAGAADMVARRREVRRRRREAQGVAPARSDTFQ